MVGRLAVVWLHEESRVKIFSDWCRFSKLAVVLAFLSVPHSTMAVEWKQTASVDFVELPWGRFARITIEYLPDLGDSYQEIGEYMDPAKRAQLMAEIQAEAASGSMEEVGRTILITVPGLEYGMTGSWSDVRIESGNGISVPPDEPHIGSATSEGQNTRYTGVLTITEFSEDVLKGHFRADLFNADASRSEYEAGRRDLVGQVGGELDFDLSPIDAPEVSLAEVPDELSDSDAELLKRIQAAGVPQEVQGEWLERLRGLNPAMQQMVLDSQSDSY